MNDNRKKKEKSKLQSAVDNIVVVISYVSGVGYMTIQLNGELEKLNLGQDYNSINKYKSRNEKGIPTGRGYAFEDAIMRHLKDKGVDFKQVKTMKNGADFIIDGVNIQVKCNQSVNGAFNALFKNGQFRYPNMEIWTNSEIASDLQAKVNANPSLFNGKPPIIKDCGISVSQADKEYHRGIDALKADATEIVHDKNFQVYALSAVLAVFFTSWMYDTVKDYKNEENEGNKSFVKSAKKSAKKHWLKYSLCAIATAITSVAIHLGIRQLRRPSI
jgi:hypothetical protein